MGGGGSKKKKDEDAVEKKSERWYPGKNVRRATALKDKYKKTGGGRLESYVPVGGYARYDALYEADPNEVVLGTGRLGRDVVTARRRADGRVVAVKTVTGSRASFADMQRQYACYAALKALPPREAVVPVLDVCLEEDPRGVLRSACEVCEHGNLASYVEREKPWSEMAARKIMKRVVTSLHRVHELGYVHRQIRLENILVAAADCSRPLIGGWTMASPTTRAEGETPDMTYIEKAVDALYLAPELFKCFEPAHYGSAKQDVFACGVLLHILLFGKSPYSSTDSPTSGFPEDVEQQVMDARRANFDTWLDEDTIGPLVRTVHEPCLEVMRQMLRHDPAKRPDLNAILHLPWFFDPLIPAQHDRHLAQKAVGEFIENHRKAGPKFMSPPASPASSPAKPAAKKKS